jgi:hypothetical protein
VPGEEKESRRAKPSPSRFDAGVEAPSRLLCRHPRNHNRVTTTGNPSLPQPKSAAPIVRGVKCRYPKYLAVCNRCTWMRIAAELPNLGNLTIGTLDRTYLDRDEAGGFMCQLGFPSRSRASMELRTCAECHE